MESLDEFRDTWQSELHQEQISSERNKTDLPYQPIGDLCRLGVRSKRSVENDDDESLSERILLQTESVPNPTAVSTSFTIGIRHFTTSKSPIIKLSDASLTKKVKHSTDLSLVDQLIRDIDEITDIPFFNVTLPREIALKIFEYLSINDLFSCLQVCRSWNSISSDELLWSNIYKRLKICSKIEDNSVDWKENVKNGLLFYRKIRQNFRNHQCRTTNLTYFLGLVLTCANRDATTIVAGYSRGIVRTWPIKSIMHIDETHDNGQDFDEIPEIIYESGDTNPMSNSSCVQSVGLVENSLYGVHENGFVEVWHRDTGKQPYLSQQLLCASVDQVNDDHRSRLCVSTCLRFHVWDLSTIRYQEFDFFNEYNDTIRSFCVSSDHGTPVSIIAGKKSLWCVSLNDITNRYAFYSLLSLDYISSINIDIRSDEPIATFSFGREIKLFDLECGRCNILSNDYHGLPADVRLIRANQCPRNEFVASFENYQISIFDQRLKEGAVQNYYGHHGTITTLQMDSSKLVSTDRHGFVRLWDRRMSSKLLWHVNPKSHPVTFCSFDDQTLVFASTPICKHINEAEYQTEPELYSGNIYVSNFTANTSTRLDKDLEICTSTYDAPEASTNRIDLYTPYDMIG